MLECYTLFVEKNFHKFVLLFKLFFIYSLPISFFYGRFFKRPLCPVSKGLFAFFSTLTPETLAFWAHKKGSRNPNYRTGWLK